MMLIIIMIFCFSACGSSDSTETDNSQTSEESSQETEVVKEEAWIEEYYVDDFYEPTDERYITNSEYIEGVFSNSATTDSNLNVVLCIDEEYIGIFLYEYGNRTVKNSSSSYNDDYTITMKDGSGNETTIRGAIYPGGDRIALEGEDRSTFIDYLCGDEDFKVLIMNDEYTTTQYLFKVSPGNFAEIY